MLVEDKVSYDAANEAYCLLVAYLNEERIAANYDREHISEFVGFLSQIIKNPNNFVDKEETVEILEQ